MWGWVGVQAVECTMGVGLGEWVLGEPGCRRSFSYCPAHSALSKPDALGEQARCTEGVATHASPHQAFTTTGL